MPTHLRVNDKELLATLEAAGDALFPYLFRGLRRSFGAYRREFNRGTHVSGRTADIRGGQKGLKIRAPNAGGPRYGFFWKNYPSNEQSGKLDDIRVEFFTGSPVAEALEFGATFRAKGGKKFIAIPIGFAFGAKRTKRNFLSPSRARRAGFRLVYLPRRNGKGPFLAVDANAKRHKFGPIQQKTGKRRGRKPKKRPVDLKVVFALVPSAVIKPQLGFYRGWDRFKPERDKRMGAGLDAYLREHWAQPSAGAA